MIAVVRPRVERIEVTYKVITPLFCGGANGAVAEVRLPSVKGVLRWWWRALAWSRCNGDLRKIHDEEAVLFGSADGGQSKVIMRLEPSAAPKVLRPDEVLKVAGKVVGEGARYLGYGVMETLANRKRAVQAGQLTRACLETPFTLKLELRARALDDVQRTSLLHALQAMGLLGGFGAKSRKGYGSLVLQSMSLGDKPCWSPPTSADALTLAIAKLLPQGSAPAALPSYTALSPRSRIVLLSARARSLPLELLDLVGRELMRYRSWGHNGKVLGCDREENFKDDHDLMKQHASERRTHPRRIVFGLPHNYGKHSGDKVGPHDHENGDRRASPLLVHIHECDAKPVAVLSFLPARFLSNGDAATIDVGGTQVSIARDPELWQPIEALLDRFLDPRLREEPFGHAVEVSP